MKSGYDYKCSFCYFEYKLTSSEECTAKVDNCLTMVENSTDLCDICKPGYTKSYDSL